MRARISVGASRNPTLRFVPTAVFESSHPLEALQSLRFETRDVDEACARFARMYAAGRVNGFSGGDDFCWRVETYVFGGLRLTRSEVPGDVGWSAPDGPGMYSLVFARGGACAFDYRGEELAVAHGKSGVIIRPGEPVASSIAPGYRGLTLGVERAVLDAHYFKLSQSPQTASLDFEPFVDANVGAGAALLRLLTYLGDELAQRDGVLASPVVRANLHDAVLSALLSLHSRDFGEPRAPKRASIAPGNLRRAEEWMSAHASEAITVPDVAAAVGVSVRTLQDTFRRYRGVTPLEFLRARRLEVARVRLLQPEEGTTVSAVAASVGFIHAGRFAAEYRRRFGESPAATLRRGAVARGVVTRVSIPDAD